MSRHLIPDGCMGHDEIAARLGVSRQTVANIEARAMRKLRLAMRSTARGPVSDFLYSSEGVPEPVGFGELNRIATERARTRSRRGGRWA